MNIDKIIKDALLEDIPTIDVTTDNIFTEEESICYVVCKEDGILSGIDVFQRVFEIVDASVVIELYKQNGESIYKYDEIAVIKGKTASILKSERIALNLMQRMSGIATMTSKFVSKIKNNKTKILDTRKTTPNLRILEKRAVVDGGGKNHRFCLSDQVMIKDNHIEAAGSITKAVELVKSKIESNILIEVEVENKEMFLEAMSTDCDIIMLDNMSNELTRECVLINNGQKLIEASGNMILERIYEVSETGVDYISVGALTHSVKALDISMKFNKGRVK